MAWLGEREKGEGESVLWMEGEREGWEGFPGVEELELTRGAQKGDVASKGCVFDTYSTRQIRILRVQPRILRTEQVT